MELLAVERLDVVEGVAGVVDEGVLGEVAAVPPDLGAQVADGGVHVVAGQGGLREDFVKNHYCCLIKNYHNIFQGELAVVNDVKRPLYSFYSNEHLLQSSPQ